MFLILIRALVAAGQVGAALAVCERRVRQLDPAAALEALPQDLPLARVQPFLTASLHSQAAEQSNAQVMHQLARTDNISIKGKLLAAHKRYALVTRRTVCADARCGLAVQADQALARLPTGEIVHLACKRPDAAS